MAVLIVNSKKFENIFLAITKEEQIMGLMFEENPYIIAFPYKTSDKRKFWMKDTPAELDIIFCNAGRVIYMCKGEPFDESLLGPEKESNLIIEAPSGFVENNNIKIGNNIRLRLDNEELMRILNEK